MKILINFADKQYEPARRWNSWSGKHVAGFERVCEFTPNDIEPEFADEHKDILSYKRGSGLWLWKPYFINKVLKDCSDGDIVFYCDSGALFVKDINCIIELITKDSPLFVCDIPLIESCFTKPICFEKMGLISDKYKFTNQIIATFFCFLVTPQTRSFMAEWLNLCCDMDLISPAGLGKFEKIEHCLGKEFVSHREDQSIFSLLCKKHNVQPHRDISQRGKRPETYYSPYYAYNVPEHIFDEYKTLVFLHKSPSLNLKWLLRYCYHSIFKK